MNRNSDWHGPITPRLPKEGMSQGNLWLRIILMGMFIAIAVASLSYGIRSVLPDISQGWQDIQVSKSQTGCQTQYQFQYNIGAGGKNGTAEYREVALTYGEITDEAFMALDVEPREHVLNLAVLNRNPNTAQAVEPILLDAIKRMQEQNSRFLYYGPTYRWYYSFYNSTDDAQAEMYDPDRDAGAAEYVSQMAAFAADPAAIDLKVDADGRVELMISEAYLQFAQENEIVDFLDFGWMKNAFILDALAQRMVELGHTNGVISSFDGFCRTLGGEGYAVNLFERREGQRTLTAVVKYDGAKSTVSFRSFPMSEMDGQNYYTYQDGTVRGPYVDAAGQLQMPLDNLLALSDEEGCAELAMQMLPAYTSGNPTDGNFALTRNGEVQQHGSGFAVEKAG